MTDPDIRQQIARVKADIAQYEDRILQLEADTNELQNEIDEFHQQYDKIVRPVARRLEIMRDAIEELRKERHLRSHMRYARPMESMWTPPQDYVPIETQYYKVWIEPKQNPEYFESPPPPRKTVADATFTVDPKLTLKRLYRALARRYHPDLASDEQDRAYRNRVMVLINAAYTEEDLDALQALADKEGRPSSETPLAVLNLRRLQAERDELAYRVSRLQGIYDDLLHCEMMRLKIDVKLAQSQGRDLLSEMAEHMENEYWNCAARLDQLRRMGDD
jgi:hypothetical protein